jgi:hypothetical protein
MSEAAIESDLVVGGRAIDVLFRILWRCGTFVSGVIAMAVGVLYVKVSLMPMRISFGISS